MATPKINLSFTRFSDTNLSNKGEGIYGSMLNNPYFLNPIPSMVDVEAAITNYSNALSAATNRSRDNVAAKNQTRITLIQVLVQLGLYVATTANGDAQKLISSGYTLRKANAPVYITTPGYAMLTQGLSSGDMVATVPTVPGAKSYQMEIAADPLVSDSDWKSYPSTASSFTFTGLVPGKKYLVRVAALGARKQVAYGPVSSQYAQ